MHFLIDYENVSGAGLHGASLLRPTDSVTIFYGDKHSTMPGEYLAQLQRSKCSVEFIPVTFRKKNALDFYLTTYVAERFVNDEEYDRICIVSKDTDFEAVRDYWQHRKRMIFLDKSIMYGFANHGPGGGQKDEAVRLLKPLLIKEISKDYELAAVIGDAEKVEAVKELMGQGSKALYLGLLKLFGRTRGLEVYRKVKEYENGTGISGSM
ncbi:MAG: NYN domain-containing protein [Oscillospiraceae bacterium]|nr:NYN domain-containing protein [Oscillospiraceae bacterium]